MLNMKTSILIVLFLFLCFALFFTTSHVLIKTYDRVEIQNPDVYYTKLSNLNIYNTMPWYIKFYLIFFSK